MIATCSLAKYVVKPYLAKQMIKYNQIKIYPYSTAMRKHTSKASEKTTKTTYDHIKNMYVKPVGPI